MSGAWVCANVSLVSAEMTFTLPMARPKSGDCFILNETANSEFLENFLIPN